MDMDTYLGESYSYWTELKARLDADKSLAPPDLIKEILVLRGKVSFYEDRIKKLSEFMEMK